MNKTDKIRECVRESKSEGDGFKENDIATVAMGTAARFCRDVSMFICVFCVRVCECVSVC